MQFFRFLVVGGIAASVNFIARIALSRWLGYTAAIVLAYLCGLVTAFLLNRRYVFRGATNRLPRQMFWFVVVNLVAITQTLVVSLLMLHFVLPWIGVSWHAEELAHVVGIVTPIFTSYVGHKRLSFSSG